MKPTTRRTLFRAALGLAVAGLGGRAIATTGVPALAAFLALDGNAKRAVQKTLTLHIPTSPDASPVTVSAAFAVPPGKRWVIEYIGGEEELGLNSLTLTTTVNGVSAPYPLAGESGYIGTDSPFRIALPVRIYADPGTAIQITGTWGNSQQDARAYVSFSGYLVDLP